MLTKVTPATENSDPETQRRWREFLSEQVRDLARRNLLTPLMMEEVRRTDQALIVDLDGPRFTISSMPRQHQASFVPADCADKMLLQLVQGQPVLEPTEATAAWCFVYDLSHPGSVSTHMRCGHFGSRAVGARNGPPSGGLRSTNCLGIYLQHYARRCETVSPGG